jgi:hypothetical protein
MVIVGVISWKACWLSGVEESDLALHSEVSNVCQVQSPRKVEALTTDRVDRIGPVWTSVS